MAPPTRKHLSESDIEITSVTYKGEEIFIIRDDHEEEEEEEAISTQTPKPFVRKGSFRFLDLPAELRVAIYSYLLPHNVVISYTPSTNMTCSCRKADGSIVADNTRSSFWRIEAKSKRDGKTLPICLGNQEHHRPKLPSWRRRWLPFQEPDSDARDDWLKPQTQMFSVNKETYNEVQGKLPSSESSACENQN